MRLLVSARLLFATTDLALRRRRDLTHVSNVCEAAPRYLFGTPEGLSEWREIRFEFFFSKALIIHEENTKEIKV